MSCHQTPRKRDQESVANGAGAEKETEGTDQGLDHDHGAVAKENTREVIVGEGEEDEAARTEEVDMTAATPGIKVTQLRQKRASRLTIRIPS